MIPFKLTEEYLAEIEQLIDDQQDRQLSALLAEVHYADVAEIINELDEDHATYLIKLLDSEKRRKPLRSWMLMSGRPSLPICLPRKLPESWTSWIRMMPLIS